MSGPLDGVRVLDLGAFFAGPFSARLLGDLGADVIKLEACQGDQMRPITRVFGMAHRSKRGIAVDLKTEAGQEIARRLAAEVDIVCHNMRPGAAERIGVGYEDLRKVNPEVIYLEAPGWGNSGPYASRPGMAPLFSAYVGHHFELVGDGNPPIMPAAHEDHVGGMVGAVAALMALHHRNRTGQGQHIESAQLNATMLMVMHVFRTADGTAVGERIPDHGQHGLHALDRLYRTSDGWICVSAMTDAEAEAVGVAAGLGAFDDERFATAAARATHDTELIAGLEPAFMARTTAELAASLAAAGAPFSVPTDDGERDLFTDGSQLASGRVEERQDVDLGTVREIGLLVRHARTPGRSARTAPQLGEHTDEVLGGLGMSAQEIDDLRSSGVIR